MAPAGKPAILLIGAGTFGKKHLENLLSLERKGLLSLLGVVVKTESTRKDIQDRYGVPTYDLLSDELLGQADAVDIVTPAETHYELISRCLPKVHVFVEKPLVTTAGDLLGLEKLASRSPHALMVGHIYRFHPVILRLKEILEKMKKVPDSMDISFINPIDLDNGRDIELEMFHPFDIMDFLFKRSLTRKYIEHKGRTHVVSAFYGGDMQVVLKMGWHGENRQRILNLLFEHEQIVCDLDRNIISIYRHGVLKKRIDVESAIPPLESELTTFVKLIKARKRSQTYPDVRTAARVLEMVLAGHESAEAVSTKPRRKKVAIIGAGIFGTNAAIELAPDCDVTIFEKNSSIFSEATWINQYRHHWGYHYPRSQETVENIRSAIGDFEERYGEAIITEFPTYYNVAKKGSKVTAEEFISFCDKNSLPYTREYPHEDFLNKEKIAACLKTYEPIYDYERLKKITSNKIRRHDIKVRLNEEVFGARILQTGKKVLKIRDGEKTVREEEFDYVVNATYARYNNFCKWLGFRRKPIRLDLVEVLWVKLDFPKISIAVMDGEFTNIVPTGKDNIFTLVHIKESILRRFVPKDGLVPKDIFRSTKNSHVQKILDKSIEWFPFVKNAKVVKVHYVLRAVNAYREHDDARTSDITEHGFGCFSILGGKIINAVSIGKQLSRMIEE